MISCALKQMEMGDIILSTAAQQYGGFTVPEVDKILEPYAEKSYFKYYEEYMDMAFDVDSCFDERQELEEKADKYATDKVHRDFEQGWQGIEMKLNSVGSSRGDYPFVTMTTGLATSKFGKMASITLLDVHSKGQGKKGFKRPVLFPKIVFLYDKELHGDGSDKYPLEVMKYINDYTNRIKKEDHILYIHLRTKMWVLSFLKIDLMQLKQ